MKFQQTLNTVLGNLQIWRFFTQSPQSGGAFVRLLGEYRALAPRDRMAAAGTLVAVLLLVVTGVFSLMRGSAGSGETPEPDRRPYEKPTEPAFFQIKTGSISGTYYPVGEMLASIISHPIGSITCRNDRPCGPEGLIVTAEASDGSVDNVMEVDAGVVQSALAQADIVSWAYTSKNVFRGQAPYSDLRVIANLYDEDVHLVALKGSDIHTVADLEGRRVSIDRPQSGTNYDARMILDAFGLKAHQVDLVEADANTSADMLLSGELEAFFFVGGTPLRAVADLAKREKIDLIPITGPEVDALLSRHHFFRQKKIAAGTYDGIGATPTLSIGAMWIVNARVDERTVYQITRALWSDKNHRLLMSGHVKGAQMSLDSALTGLPVPLHEGAARYYREIGLLTEEDHSSKDAP
ncbi:MAG: TAXI family TRAP transporter solute-binding subunit [Alphaproteobacteria bacterium]|nr:MAG: TAXI family TRAP transporter solute-binding subunit [Alphaproteobacteria bacterium]